MPPASVQECTPPDRTQATPLKSSWLSWGGKGVLTLVDQGLIGGSNFLIAILLARQLTPEQYGGYALVFEIFMVFSLAYACLILEPMLVFGSSVYRNNFRQYFGVLLWLHVLIALIIVLLLGGSALLAELSKSPSLPRALVGAMVAGPCVFLFWLVRRAFYVKLDPQTAVMGGLVYCAVQIGGLLIFYKLRLLSPFVAFLLMAAGALTASIMLLARLRPSMELKPRCPTLREVSQQSWGYGRWALASAVASWFCGNIFYLLLSIFGGLADTGALKALLNFASPAGQVFAALSMLTLPYAARCYQQNGVPGVGDLSRRWFIPLYSGGTAVYWALFLLFKHPIVHFLYAGKYVQVEYLIPWVALASVLRVATVAQMVALKAIQAPFLVFIAFVISDIISLLVGIPAIWAFGLDGAICAYVLSGAGSLIAGIILLRRAARRDPDQKTQFFFRQPEPSPQSN
jgi:O-antigen/teichoic acid export membrane protein